MPARRITHEEFLQRAISIHGAGKYFYTKVEFDRLSDPVVITCSLHGDFTQAAGKHLGGQGCRKCSAAKLTLSFEEFLQKSHSVHGETYSYEKAQYSYSKSTAKVEITCRVHGSFFQVAYKHYGGQGCPHCKSRVISSKQKMAFKEFVDRATSVHGTKYTYHPESFSKGNALTKITCKIHGEFMKNASAHLTGEGCQKCSFDEGARKSALKTRVPFEEFVQRANKIFQGRYEYSKATYSALSKTATVYCPDHGDFTIQAVEHTKGFGCPNCSFSRSRPELVIRSILKELDVISIEQWAPESLRVKVGRRLRYDFFLPGLSIIIEFDGRHHFEPAFGSTEEKALEVLRRTQENDRIKNEWAGASGMTLYRLTNERSLKKDIPSLISHHLLGKV